MLFLASEMLLFLKDRLMSCRWNQQLNASVVMKVMEPFLYSSLVGMTYLSCLTKLKRIVFLEIPESFLSFLFMVQCLPSINVKYLIAHLPTRGSHCPFKRITSSLINELVYLRHLDLSKVMPLYYALQLICILFDRFGGCCFQ